MNTERNLKAGVRSSWILTVVIFANAVIPILMAKEGAAQISGSSQTQIGKELSFDVASVRQNKSGWPGGDKPSSNVPLGPGDVYSPIKSLFLVRNYPLVSLIAFAYRMTDGQLDTFRAMAPRWVLDDRFDIQARTNPAGVTKDQLRLMMRSLIAERFNLSVHYETRQLRAYALLMAKQGTTGPNLRLHPVDSPCATTLPKKGTPEATASGFPTTCGGIVSLPASDPHDYKIGGSGISISLLANSLSGWGSLGRPVVDKTGLQGAYDFTLEFAPEPLPAAPSETAPERDGPAFHEALKKQLGLKIESEKGEVQVLVLDHIDHLIAN